jgi:tetratricopeptide (TPR) repeat protein
MMVRKIKWYSVICLISLSTVLHSVYANGLPGEFLVTQRWMGMNALRSPITNPALMTEENYASVRVGLAPVLQGAFLLGDVGTIIPIGLYQSVGVSLFGQFDGDVTSGTIDPNFSSNEIRFSDSTTLSNTNLVCMLSYAWHFWNRFSAGANVKVVYASNFGENPKRGLGVDLGLTYRLFRNAFFGDHVLGVSIQNLLTPPMSDGYSIAVSEKGALARSLKVLWFGNYWERRFETAVDFDLKDIGAAAEEFKSSNGVEAASKLEWDVNLKLSAWLLRILKLSLQFGLNENALDYWGFALGTNLASLNKGRDLDVLYQYNIMTEENNEATAHTINLRMDFGKHREEIFARKMARLASLSPNELYNRGRKLYSEGKYWDAFFVFTRISVEFPDFFKNDWVEYFRGSCQENLDMRDMALKTFEETRKTFPLSSAVPHTELGMMRVYYRNGDFDKVNEQFNILNQPNVQDSLRFHAAYLQGQAILQKGETASAIDLFGIIPDTHPDYIFAQHATAVAKARLGGDLSEVVPYLENCISYKAVTEAQKEVINRSYVFLGYIFYEDNAMSKAVVALRMVPTSSHYAEDALLGQGWTALKSRQWNDCVLTGQLLVKTTKKPVLQCEGMLIEAYGSLLQKNYGEALSILKKAQELVRSLREPSKDSLDMAKMQYESNRVSHNYLADQVDNFAKVSPLNSRTGQQDSLKLQQQDFMKKFDEYYSYVEDFGRTSFFSRNLTVIGDDIDYALATIEKIVGQTDVIKEQQKMENRQQQIDTEIEQLKKEMEKLQNQQ